MRQYKHLLILQPETAPPDVWKQITKGVEQLQADGYCMSDYHELQTFTVLVFERGETLAQKQVDDIEYKHFPRPCPYCGRSENISDYFQGLTHYYMCDNTACGARGPLRPTQPAALAAWNGSPSL